jgi:hypothetical protein
MNLNPQIFTPSADFQCNPVKGCRLNPGDIKQKLQEVLQGACRNSEKISIIQLSK